ncbi:bifunctional diguanylate cyclase/phosphodiesterase [Desulfuromonas versatilis]|uniref:Bifunctional diguanylate cyclase/phosphodiesterase n=1 Tax=Desulfuromonas versatilis TaxID=2802975 RepID=A0ABM8HQ46_9BACT|nr:EAL domain-containing protein [Desulfuromonas versatilis]BCR03860.1 bifunctional diguanylate cyclase/phosphodiesterase [Desulfuromonas versatilis]
MVSQEYQERFQFVFNLPAISALIVNARGEFLEANPFACQFLGYAKEEMAGLSVREVTHPEDLEKSLAFYSAEGLQKHRAFHYRKRFLRKDGQTVWGQVSAAWIPGELGEAEHGLVLLQDITEHQTAQESVAAERSFFQSVVDSLGDPVKVVDLNQHILTLNRAAKKMLPENAPAPQTQRCDHASRACQLPCSALDGACNLAVIQKTGQPLVSLQRLELDSGEVHVYEITATPLWNEQGELRGIVETSRNITERLKAAAKIEESEKRLEYLTHYDPLTRLPNQALLLDRLQQTLARAQRSSGKVAVLLLDLDRFKAIIQSLGGRSGNLLLAEVARRLELHVRKADTLARYGEDEFVVVLEQFGDINQVVEVAQRLLDELAREADLDGVPVFVTASIGISLFPEDAGDGDGLLRRAEAAMQRAQEEGGNAYQFYTSGMTTQTRERLELEAQLREAIRSDQLQLYYQPQVNLVSGRCIGSEALVRWMHPHKGMISPGAFIPLAEETGLIEPLGLWGLRTACAWNRSLQERGLTPVPVSVNISARQFFRPNFSALVARILEETGLEARYLELEITESMLMKDVKTAIAVMQQLKEQGISLALDDFGTGYSSLSYLRQFPIKKLKIDQSFIRDLVRDANAAAITRAVIALAQSLNLRVIAEGVETREQAELLKTMGCYEIQGYLFSRPLPAKEAEAYLARG